MSFLSQPISLFSIGPKRSFSTISDYITVTESTIDALEITQQPVQQGAMIADHVFKKPVTLAIQIKFPYILSQSLSQIYQQLLDLQTSFKPIDVVTPKRTYKSMLISALGQTTDKKTENCLAINVSFQEVILVTIQTTVVPKSQLRNPASNASTQNAGNKSAAVSTVQGLGFKPTTFSGGG